MKCEQSGEQNRMLSNQPSAEAAAICRQLTTTNQSSLHEHSTGRYENLINLIATINICVASQSLSGIWFTTN